MILRDEGGKPPHLDFGHFGRGTDIIACLLLKLATNAVGQVSLPVLANLE